MLRRMIATLIFVHSFITTICFAENRPNIILIVADDLGFNDVPWHNDVVIAPNLKQLAEEGIILEQSYVLPICTPSRSALLTGIYPFAIGRQGSVIWPTTPTGLTTDAYIIPQLLKPLGYSTHAVGKWHLGFCNWKYTPTERGFDTFRGYYTGSEDYFSHTRTWDYALMESDLLTPKNESNFINKITEKQKGKRKYPMGYDFRDNREPYLKASNKYSTYEFASHVENVLQTSDPSVPIFLYMAFQSVHAPLQVPENYTDLYRNIKNKKRRTYLGMVTAMDEAIGRIVRALKESEQYNNSVIVFTTDNGGPTVWGGNNWPLRGNKTTLWEGGTRGAAFIHSPLLSNKGTVYNNLIHVTDWMATLVNLAGGLPPTSTDSIDQWEALNGRAPPPRNEVVYNFNKKEGVQAAIRVGDYKLIIGNPGPGDWIPPPEMGLDFEGANKLGSDGLKDWQRLMMNAHKNQCRTIDCFKMFLASYVKIIHKHKLKKEAWVEIKDVIKNILKQILTKEWRSVRKIGTANRFPLNKHITDPLPFEGHQLSQSRIAKEFRSVSNISERKLGPSDAGTLLDSSVKELMESSLDIRLYNLKDDPQERTNLSEKRKDKVAELTKRLLVHNHRYVPPDEPKSDEKGDPKYWDGTWSPGWCQ